MAASNGSEFPMIGGTSESVFARPSYADSVAENEEELMWAAIQRLPSQKQCNVAILKSFDDMSSETVDVRKLDRRRRALVVDKALATYDQDNHRLLSAIKQRLDRLL